MIGFSPLWAGVYRWVDPTGQVHYSDQPGIGAKEIELREPTVYTPVNPSSPAATGTTDQQQPADAVEYTAMTITSPADDEAIRSNPGTVDVAIELEPALFKGHKVRIYLDGSAASGELDATNVTLQNVDRGTHTLQAAVVDAGGRELIRSAAITFHMLRIATPRVGPFSGGG